MRKKTAKLLSLAMSALLLLCSCHENTQPAETLKNGNFGGILFDTSVTADSAEPIPQLVVTSETHETESTVTTAETSGISEEITSATTTTAETTTAKSTTTTPPAETAATTVKTTVTTTKATTKKTTTTEKVTTTPKTTTTPETTTTKKTTAVPETTTTPKATTTAEVSVPADEVRGVWISYLEISTLLKGKSKSEFTAAAGKIYDNCVSLGINTVYVHARAFGDAFYKSDLFPFTKYISGEIGVNVSYDPYEILVEEAQKRGLSFHAWINPLRLCTAEDMKSVKSGFTMRDWYDDPDLKGKYIVNVSGTWYLNPAYDETIELVCDGIKEILENYDVDGIHIDDYFYPTTDSSFDSAAFNASDYNSLSKFRINNCNELVKAIYDTVHKYSGVVFGASTQGSIENNINQLYADAEAWCKGGYVDYFAPQIYYGFDNSAQPFEKCTDTWLNLVKGTDTKLYIGLAVYKIGKEDTWAGSGKYEWCNTETMLKRQTEYARKNGCDGIVLYSYNYIFTSGYATNDINKEIANLKPLLK